MSLSKEAKNTCNSHRVVVLSVNGGKITITEKEKHKNSKQEFDKNKHAYEELYIDVSMNLLLSKKKNSVFSDIFSNPFHLHCATFR